MSRSNIFGARGMEVPGVRPLHASAGALLACARASRGLLRLHLHLLVLLLVQPLLLH